ncbi:hypothetical protein [Arthrobacter sp. M4]|uniref:hypothetical protein n=1 Tax=Arthrobacter sp. M4 TaxID=218160 RepID=UPI001CDB5EF3|nr:hypothetical protein [Arthrobacter sp. M4]MCA4135311.1 hypothetical protein [Arthrobacter sp. M4]
MAKIPGWTGAGPIEKAATLIAVPGAPVLFVLIYVLQRQEGGGGFALFFLGVYIIVGLAVAFAARRERIKRMASHDEEGMEGQ